MFLQRNPLRKQKGSWHKAFRYSVGGSLLINRLRLESRWNEKYIDPEIHGRLEERIAREPQNPARNRR